jgi:Tol biopolymer transport system component
MKTAGGFGLGASVATCFFLTTLDATTPAFAAPGDTELISASLTTGEAAGGDYPAISPDGRYVVYSAAGDTILLRDRLAGVTERIDVGTNGQAAECCSLYPDVSADGRFVTFMSDAANLVPGDSNPYGVVNDIFVRDRKTGTTERVSVGPRGEESNADCLYPRISADGRFVAFWTLASNLVDGDTNGAGDIFMRERQTGVTERVSIGYGSPADGADSDIFGISEEGRYLAFWWNTTIFVRDRWLGVTEPVAVPPTGEWDSSGNPEISANGRFVVFIAYRVNWGWDVFLHDRVTGLTERQSVNAAGTGAHGNSWYPDVSADGRFVVFWSEASNLVPGDTNGVADIFVRDRVTKQIQRVNVSSAGTQSTGYTDRPRISSDGRFVVFPTTSWLSPLDTNAGLDIYLHEMSWTDPGTIAYSVTPQALAFGSQTLTTGRTKTFWLSNTGTTALPVLSIELTGKNPAVFSVSHTCEPWVAVGNRCAIKVTYRPTWQGDQSAVVKIVAGDKPISRQVTGTGVVSAFELSPRSLFFGSVTINTTSPAQTVKITNTGQGVLPVKSVSLWGTNKYQFTKSHNCPSYVAVGGSCTASVRFTPTAVGAKSANLAVWAAGGAGGKSAAMYGTGR